MNETDSNRPLRVFEKVLHGGLGAGNIGVLTSRHGTGKEAVLMCVAVDKAMDGKNVLHVALNRPVADIRAYRDEVLGEIEKSLDLQDRTGILTRVERHTRIHTYRDGTFNLDRLRQTLTFAREHAEFTPDMLDIEGWPDFNEIQASDLASLRQLATDFGCEVWLTHHSHRDAPQDAATGLPQVLAPLKDQIAVVVGLEPEARHVPLNFLKVHDHPLPQGINLDFDPRTMLIRWR